MKNDLRFALRMLATHRWFSAAVIVTLALGIGINTTVFTLVNAVLFKPVPLPGGERLVTVYNQNVTRANNRTSLSFLDYEDYKAQNRTFEDMEAINNTQIVIAEENNPPEQFRGARVTPGMFDLLHTPPVLGRGFKEENGRTGAPVVALISDTVWKKRYNRDPGVVGRAVRINAQPATIIGVMPPGFQFPQNEDVWIPFVPNEETKSRSNRQVMVMGILKPGTRIETAAADLAVISQRLAKTYPDSNKDLSSLVSTFHQTYNGGPIRSVFLTMLGAVAFVLVIACSNVANMMLSRAVARTREISVRAAMGATRGQLIRQLLVESVLLSSLGGVLGLGLSLVGVHLFDLATRDVGKPYWIVFSMDWVAFGYFAALSIFSGILFGLVPALRASRVDLNTALKDGTQGAGQQHGGKLTAALVVVQFALTVVLLAGAGVMVRSFFAAQTVNPFVRPDNLFTARVQLPGGKGERYAEATVRRQTYEKIIPEVAAIPGVTKVAMGSHLPGMGSTSRAIEIEGKPNDNPEQLPRASLVVQTPGYLPTIGLPLLLGRDFDETDGDPGKEATVVTRAFASKHWPNEVAVGKRLRFIENKKPGPWMTVIGVCGDIVFDLQTRGEEPPPLIYTSYRQDSWSGMALLARTSGDPANLAGPMRAIIQKLDQDLPLFEVRTMTAALDRQRWFLTVFGTLFAVFALAGLLIASVGIYAVVAHSTARRTREIGVRMALGSTAGGIVRLVLARGLVQLGIGLVLGLAGAFAATRLLKSVGFLAQVSPNDPLVFSAITFLLAGIGVAACLIPALRAARIDPTKALRTE